MSATELDIEARAAAAINPADFEPLVRKFADDFYERLLDGVRDYMVDNTQFNIGSTIHMLEASLKRSYEQNTALLAVAIQARDDIRWPPSPDSLGRRLEALDAAIAKATGA